MSKQLLLWFFYFLLSICSSKMNFCEQRKSFFCIYIFISLSSLLLMVFKYMDFDNRERQIRFLIMHINAVIKLIIIILIIAYLCNINYYTVFEIVTFVRNVRLLDDSVK